MKKIFSVVLIAFVCLFMININYCFATGKQINANIKTKRLEKGTVINLKTLSDVSSLTAKIGQQIDFMVTDNIIVRNSVVIPEGTVVRGIVQETIAPKKLYKGGSFRVYFDHIVSPTGKQVPFQAGICNNQYLTYDGSLSSNTNYLTALNKTVDNTKNIVTVPVKWAWTKGEEIKSGKTKYVFAPITAIVTVPVAGIYFVGDSVVDMFKKGEDISLQQGDIIQVKLLQSLDMPVY